MRIVTLIGALCLAGSAWAAPSAVPVRVAESRTKELVAPAKSMVMFGQPPLTVTLRLDSPEVSGATIYRNLHITQATDDTGASLVLKGAESPFGNSMQLRSPMAGMGGGLAPNVAAPEVDVRLAMPSRKATMIRVLKGDLQVPAGGQEKTIEVNNVTAMVGKKIEDPALKQSGLAVEVADPKAVTKGMGITGPSVAVRIGGDADAIRSVDVVDAMGKVISQGCFTSADGVSQTRTLGLAKPADASARLRIKVIVGQKVVTVPFELKDIPLP